MSQDPYAMLGVTRDADAETIKKAYRRLARQLHPDVNPDPETQERFKEVSRAYEILSDPQKRAAYDRGGDVFAGMGGFGQGAGFSFTDIMDAFFGGTARPGRRHPRSAAAHAPRPGRADPARGRPGRGGVRRRSRAQGRHRGRLHDLPRRGYGGRLAAGPVRDLSRGGRGRPRAAVVPRRDPHPAALRGLPRLRHDHPRPVPRVLGRRPGPLPPHPDRQDPRRRRHRHPRPARRAGRGRPGRRPGGRPLRRDPRRAAPDVQPSGHRPPHHGGGADDRRRARHHADPADPRGRPGRPRGVRRLVGRRDLLRARDQARHAVGLVPGASRPRRTRACGPAAATWSSRCSSRRRPGSTPRQEELLRELAAIRNEEKPTGQVREENKGMFGRLRDAFNGL